MRRSIVVVAFVMLGMLAGRTWAHEGHAHKVMGTVTAVHSEKVTHIEVKTAEGKTLVLTADDKTRYLKGETPATLKDVTVGSRVVATVTMSGSVTTASEIRIGAAKEEASHKD